MTLDPRRKEAMLTELEYLLRTHGDHEALSEQSSLGDLLTDMRRLADSLGLDSPLALAGAEVENDP
jgi:hypothetical protein